MSMLAAPLRIFTGLWRVTHARRLLGLTRFLWVGQRGISWRRRCVRILMLLMLLTLISATVAWRILTDPERMRRLVIRHLERELNLQVSITAMDFSLDGRLWVDGLRIYPAGCDSLLRVRRCEADLDVIQLMFGHDMPIRRVKLIEPRITLTEEPDTGRWNLPLVEAVDRRGDWQVPDSLPDVELVDAVFCRRQMRNGVSEFLAERPFTLIKSADPAAGTWALTLSFHEGGYLGAALVHDRKDALDVSVVVDLKSTRPILPEELRSLCDRHDATGMLTATATLDKGRWRGALLAERVYASDIEIETLGHRSVTDLQARVNVLPTGLEIDHADFTIAEMNGCTASVSGMIEGFDRDARIDLTMAIKGLRLPLATDDSPNGRTIEELQKRFSLQGTMGVRVSVRGSRKSALSCQGEVDLYNASLSADEFPMPVEELSGRIAYDGELIRLTNMTCRLGQAQWTLGGAMASDGGFFKLDSTLKNMPLGDPLQKALASSSLEVLRDEGLTWYGYFLPDGSCDIQCHVSRRSFEDEIDYGVALLFDGEASAEYDDFPVRIHDLKGLISLRPGVALVENLHGISHGAPARIDAMISTARDDNTFDMTITGQDMPVGEHIARGIQVVSEGEADEYYRMFNVGGTTDFTCKVMRDVDEQDVRWHVDARLNNGELKYDDFPYPLTEVEGNLEIDQSKVVVKHLVGRCGQGMAEATGVVGMGPEDLPVLDIRARNVAFDPDLLSVLRQTDERYVELWDELSPSGSGDIHFTLGYPPDDDPNDFWTLAVDCKGVNLTWREFPYTLRDVHGRIRATNKTVMLENLHCADGNTRLAMNGRMTMRDEKLIGCDLSLQAAMLPIDQHLLDVAPEYLDDVLACLVPGGNADLAIEHIRYRAARAAEGDVPAQPELIGVTGTGHLHDAALSVGMDIKAIDAAIRYDFEITDRIRVDGAFEKGSGDFGGSQLSDLDGRIAKDAEADRLTIDFTASAFSGKVNCKTVVILDEPSGYELSLLIERAKLDAMLNGSSDVSGSFDGTLVLSETLGSPESREGAGSFRVRNGQLAKAPLVVGLTNMIFLQLPVESVFSEGTGDYYLRGQTVYCRRISLKGRDVSLLGGASKSLEGFGKVNLADQTLDLVFVVGPPSLITGPAAELWSLTSAGVVKTRVSGPWSEPQIRTAAFETFRKLLAEMGLGSAQ